MNDHRADALLCERATEGSLDVSGDLGARWEGSQPVASITTKASNDKISNVHIGCFAITYSSNGKPIRSPGIQNQNPEKISPPSRMGAGYTTPKGYTQGCVRAAPELDKGGHPLLHSSPWPPSTRPGKWPR